MSVDGQERVRARRALEALRNGVPNPDAVAALGSVQRDIVEDVEAKLAEVSSGRVTPTGVLIAGGFGSGKSHMLSHLSALAIEQRFVVSTVVVSKETPLFNAGKVVDAAIENAVVPGATGLPIAALAERIDVRSELWADFYTWVNRTEDVSPTYAATVYLFERLRNDQALVEDIVGFWGGERLALARIREGLKQCGGQGLYKVATIPARQAARQRALFLSRLIRAAGFAGWLLLLDEVELIGRYSVMQRGMSYSELARWLASPEHERVPGLLVVGAVVDDFDMAVLQEKGDLDVVPDRLRAKGTPDVAARAEAGMRLIARAAHLRRPDEAALDRTRKALRDIYQRAYDFLPPEDNKAPGVDRTRSMRLYVRRLIHEWDLHRLHPTATVHIETEEMHIRWSEDTDLEATEGVETE